jgi:hypothetical protein
VESDEHNQSSKQKPPAVIAGGTPPAGEISKPPQPGEKP